MKTLYIPLTLVASLYLFTGCSHLSNTKSLEDHGLVKINPLYDQPYLCAEHAIEKMGIGDVYGRDCMVTQFVENKNGKWMQMYKGKGLKNSDWFSWNANILAPFDGEVVKIHINDKTNIPGKPIKSRASGIIMKSTDGTMVVFAHVQGLVVKVGDSIQKGQVVAKVGNNGNAWMPHIHIGAWKDKKPLQIIFDLAEWQKTVEKLFPDEYKPKKKIK